MNRDRDHLFPFAHEKTYVFVQRQTFSLRTLALQEIRVPHG